MSNKNRLKIVPYQPNDYSLGEALSIENGTVSSNADTISAAFSLYFQWEAYRNAFFYPSVNQSHSGFVCELSYDTDERSPSELWIQVQPNEFFPKLEDFSTVFIRFEVFRTCYQFECQVIAVSQVNGKKTIVTTVPDQIIIMKARKLPRVYISQEEQLKMPPVFWEDGATGEKLKLKITELGMKSLAALSESAITTQFGYFHIGQLKIKGEYLRTIDHKNIFLLHYQAGTESGVFFDFYKNFAYPSLKSRHEYSYTEGIKLYEETGYFGKFGPDKDAEQYEEVQEVWSNVKEVNHLYSADYYVVDQEQLIGFSSSTLAFSTEDTPVWFFHQLCSRKIPDLVSLSGVLYLWRCEYLAARPESLKAGVFFNGNSRWLERLYVKFSMQNNSPIQQLYSVDYQKCHFTQPKKSEQIKVSSYHFGRFERVVSQNNHFLAGAYPTYLNANENLNAIVSVGEDLSIEAIQSIAHGLMDAKKVEQTDFMVIVPEGKNIEALNGERQISNRYCLIEKADLVNLISSLNHSIAITERKLKDVP